MAPLRCSLRREILAALAHRARPAPEGLRSLVRRLRSKPEELPPMQSANASSLALTAVTNLGCTSASQSRGRDHFHTVHYRLGGPMPLSREARHQRRRSSSSTIRLAAWSAV